MISAPIFFAFTGMLLVVIFQYKRIKREQRERALMLESLEEGVLSLDVKLTVLAANYSASRMLSISKKDLVGEPLNNTSELLKKGRSLLEECMRRERVLTDSYSDRKIYFDLIAVPKKNSSGALLVLQNKSDHHKVLEIGKEFITNASHELRTPITIIKGFTETLQDMPELPREVVSEITQKILRSCQRMDLLVKNLLTLADLENLPALRLQECDIVALLENCAQLLLTAHPTVRIQIEKKSGFTSTLADPDILELALMNLLENAVKYSYPPAQIQVNVERSRNQVKLSISDQGLGIPPESISRIFSRFYTVDKARSKHLGGAGLGLSIVKTIIEKHEGEISVTSELGKGTTFTLLLPSSPF
ncbi:MAG: ATP-binding protein [Chlamydiales bacterium]|nr:ATP-binding protein [Chlamydiales bacterium]